MKTRRFFNVMGFMVLSALLLLTASCSPTDIHLFKSVPENATFVSVADLEDLSKALGCKIDDGKLVLDPALQSGLSQKDQKTLAVLGKLGKAIDMDHVVSFGTPDVELVMTAEVKDGATLESLLADEGFSKSSADGFDVYILQEGAPAVLVRDGQMWCTMNDASPSGTISALLDKAAKSDFTANRGLCEFLETDHIITAVVAGQAFAPGQSDVYVALTFDTDANHLLLTGQCLRPDGAIVEETTLQTISPDFLRYMPGNTAVAFALGVTPQMDWKQLAQLATMMGSASSRALVETVLPYLEQLDGTVAFGAAPVDAEAWTRPDAGNVQAVLMAHMSQQNVDDALASIRGLLLQTGIEVHQESEGRFSARLGDMTLYAGSYDGYLTVSNAPVSSDSSNALTTAFLNKKAAAYFDVPRGVITDEFGIRTTANMESDQLNIEMSLTGTDRRILPALLSLKGL